MLSVVMLNVVYDECIKYAFMLKVVYAECLKYALYA